MRSIVVTLALAAAFVAGCAAPSVGVGDAELTGLETPEVLVRARVSGVGGDWVSATVFAAIRASGASWASLARRSVGTRDAGVTRRLTDGGVELELGREYFSPASCEAGVCELEYVLALDAEPGAPWSAVVTVTLEGDGADTASIEITEIP